MSTGGIIGLVVGVVAVIVIIFVFSSGGWSSEIENNFIEGCMGEGASAAYCECCLEGIQDVYSEEEFIEEEAKMMTGYPSEKLTSTMMKVSMECLNEY